MYRDGVVMHRDAPMWLCGKVQYYGLAPCIGYVLWEMVSAGHTHDIFTVPS
jgi:hypothetical protein